MNPGAPPESCPAGKVAAPKPADSAGRHVVPVIGVLLAAAVLLVYGPATQHEFVNFDDQQYFYENHQVLQGFTERGVVWAFQSTYAANWHPLTWLSLMLDVELFGAGPAGPHLTNILLHAANAVLLFLLLRRLTGALWRSAMAAALFALHPAHVESVAWVAERKDVLSGMFFLLTLLAYTLYVRQVTGRTATSNIERRTSNAEPNKPRFTLHASRFYILSLFLFALGLMSKPMLVTVPFVLLLLDYWPLGRTRWARPATGENAESPFNRLLKEKLPFFALAAASCVVTYRAQRGGDTMIPLENLPPELRIANSFLVYARYLGKLLWPTDLAVFYPLSLKPSATAVAGAVVLILGITAAVIWQARREPWLVTGWFWYLGTLVPVIGLVQVGGQAMADRYTYIPGTGLFVMLCWSIPSRLVQQRIFKTVAGITAGAVLAACAWRSAVQVGYWQNSETLFRHTLDVTQDNGLAHYTLGAALGHAGRYEEAIKQYEQALRIKPDNFDAQNNLAGTLARVRRVSEAIEHWEQALRAKPDNAEVHYNLGIALEQAGKPDEAIGQYEQALWYKSDYAEAHYQLGLLLLARGRTAEAGAHVAKAVEFKPDFAEAQNTLGTMLGQQGRSLEASEHFQKAIEGKPRFAEAYNNLGNALADQGRYAEAIEQYRQALDIRPGYAEADYNLGNALALQGRYAEAIGYFQQALQLRPNYTNARRSLDAARELLNRAAQKTGD
jgi:protein O-mannosyl-transferase